MPRRIPANGREPTSNGGGQHATRVSMGDGRAGACGDARAFGTTGGGVLLVELQLHEDEVPDRAGARPGRLRPAVRRLRVLVRDSVRPAERRRPGLRHRGQPAQLHRGARRAAHRADRADRRHHRQAQGQPDRPQPRRPRRSLRGGGAPRSGGVGHHGRHPAQGRRAGGLPARPRAERIVHRRRAGLLRQLARHRARPALRLEQPAGRHRGARLSHLVGPGDLQLPSTRRACRPPRAARAPRW